jgi:hypothetical protein
LLGGKTGEQSLKILVDRIKENLDEFILVSRKSKVDLEKLAVILYRAASIMAFPNHVFNVCF